MKLDHQTEEEESTQDNMSDVSTNTPKMSSWIYLFADEQ